jgi:PAS domain S-box-containing protein
MALNPIPQNWYLRMVDEVADYAIIFLNTDGTIRNWNKGAEKIKGYKAEEIIGKHFSVFYPEEDRESQVPQHLLAVAEKEGRAEHEGWRVRKDGTLFWGSIVITALHDENNNVMGFIKLTRDLTERKKAEEQVRLNAAALDTQNKELKQFTYIASHDMKEPLRKIRTFSEKLLLDESATLSHSGMEYLHRMISAASRMQTLIDDLLSYSHASSVEKKFERTDLNMILQHVKDSMEEQISEKNARLVSTPLPAVHVIPFQFQQLLTNLFSNALKFVNPDVAPVITVTGNIEIPQTDSSNLNGNLFHLTVKDNGIGFDPRFNTKIFDLFQRLHGKNEYKGTGIGLAICKKIVENHNGFISAEGAVNAGAVFHVYIPMTQKEA